MVSFLFIPEEVCSATSFYEGTTGDSSLEKIERELMKTMKKKRTMIEKFTKKIISHGI
jgi:hypothetical protein